MAASAVVFGLGAVGIAAVFGLPIGVGYAVTKKFTRLVGVLGGLGALILLSYIVNELDKSRPFGGHFWHLDGTPVVVVIGLAILGSRALVRRIRWPFLQHLIRGATMGTWITTGLVMLVLAPIAYAGAPRAARTLVKSVGKTAPAVAANGTLALLRISAPPVCIMQLDGTIGAALTSQFPDISRNELYLGGANGIVVFYNPESRQVLRVPAGSVMFRTRVAGRSSTYGCP
jgi:hypothetical protein